MWACGHAISSNLSMAKMSVQGGSCNADEEAAAAMHVWPGMMQPGSVQGMRQPGRQDGYARQAQGVVAPDVDGDLLMDRFEAEEEARAAMHGWLDEECVDVDLTVKHSAHPEQTGHRKPYQTTTTIHSGDVKRGTNRRPLHTRCAGGKEPIVVGTVSGRPGSSNDEDRQAAGEEEDGRRSARHDARHDAARHDAARPDAAKHDAARHEAARHDAGQEATRQDAARHDAARHDARQEAARHDARHDAARQDAARPDAA